MELDSVHCWTKDGPVSPAGPLRCSFLFASRWAGRCRRAGIERRTTRLKRTSTHGCGRAFLVDKLSADCSVRGWDFLEISRCRPPNKQLYINHISVIQATHSTGDGIMLCSNLQSAAKTSRYRIFADFSETALNINKKTYIFYSAFQSTLKAKQNWFDNYEITVFNMTT